MDLLLRYFPELTEKQLSQFSRFESLFLDWNSKINLISRKDSQNLLINHILHSLAIGKVANFSPNSHVLDVGTGGGFPGIPLAILYPDTQFHLIDSIGKKIMVVKDISEQLELTNVKGEHIRAEETKHKYEYIVSRAVTRLNRFVPWIEDKFSKNKVTQPSGLLYLKGGDITEELAEVPHQKTVYELKNFFEEDFFETKKVVHIDTKEFLK